MTWHYTPESGKWHQWMELYPNQQGRLLCVGCHAEHTIQDLATASHFCPIRLPLPTAV